MPWADSVTDTFFAPELSKFTTAEIADMQGADDQRLHWLSNYLLNSALSGAFASPARQQIYNFLRRSQSAFADYELARMATERFLGDRDHAIPAYVAAVGHWEDFLTHVWQANEFLTKVIVPGAKRPMFEPGDGSANERLHSLHTRAKHAAAAILRGELVGESPLCVWLTNDGLKSTDSWLTYEEAAEELRSLAKWARVVEHPTTARDKLTVLRAEAPEPGHDDSST